MTDTSKKICINCINFMESTDKHNQPVKECCRMVFEKQNHTNIRHLVRRQVTPSDTCAFFMQKTR